MTSTPTDRCRDERALATALANCFRFFANGQAIWWVCVSHIRTGISLTCSRLYDNYYYCEYMYSFNISFCSASGRLPAQKLATNEKRKSDFSAPRSESFGKPNGLAANSRHTHTHTNANETVWSCVHHIRIWHTIRAMHSPSKLWLLFIEYNV